MFGICSGLAFSLLVKLHTCLLVEPLHDLTETLEMYFVICWLYHVINCWVKANDGQPWQLLYLFSGFSLMLENIVMQAINNDRSVSWLPVLLTKQWLLSSHGLSWRYNTHCCSGKHSVMPFFLVEKLLIPHQPLLLLWQVLGRYILRSQANF